MSDLSELRVGDMVCVVNYGGWGRGKITSAEHGPVQRITKTQICALGSRYRINDGRMVGGGYSSPRIQLFTDEIKAKIKAAKDEHLAENACYDCGKTLQSLRGEDAMKMMGFLPPVLLEMVAAKKSGGVV